MSIYFFLIFISKTNGSHVDGPPCILYIKSSIGQRFSNYDIRTTTALRRIFSEDVRMYIKFKYYYERDFLLRERRTDFLIVEILIVR